MLHGFASGRRGVSMHGVDERSFPIWCSDAEEILSHFLRVGQRRRAEAEQRMNLSQKHDSPHAVKLGCCSRQRICGARQWRRQKRLYHS
jgi:hypothetical protein